MDNCLEEMRTSATLKDFKEHLYYVIFFKSIVYVYRTTFSTVIHTFLGEGGGRLLEGGYLLNILSLRRGRYSKGGAYWKLALIRAFTVSLIAHAE